MMNWSASILLLREVQSGAINIGTTGPVIEPVLDKKFWSSCPQAFAWLIFPVMSGSVKTSSFCDRDGPVPQAEFVAGKFVVGKFVGIGRARDL
ncbi:hypothetical protein [Mesorhizobium sp.]|uniref:hypothetical protein n=1 Tax=Mesorhizobium sp. TaxID=1871066 RepID=UPI00258026A9|nr:hypothetical protein [Mesorhizobium sp.]